MNREKCPNCGSRNNYVYNGGEYRWCRECNFSWFVPYVEFPDGEQAQEEYEQPF